MKNEKIDLYHYEHELENQGVQYIGGVDEVGRGPLIGPVVTACCVLPPDFKLEGLTDSKKLSEKKREEYYEYIVKHCICYAIGSATPERIDEINIYEATKEAMLEAISKVQKQIPLEHVLIDAMPLELDIPHTSIIKGDAKSISIAAASVLAKVTRDRMLIELDKKYPMYGFAAHKGYPTKKHIEAIHQYGLIDGYRKTYGPVSDYLGLEYLDVLDNQGKRTGKIIEKTELKEHGGNFGLVHLWVVNDKKEILIAQCGPVNGKFPNQWTESAGGYIRTKESKKQAALREMKETLGIALTMDDLTHHFTSLTPPDKMRYFFDIYIIYKNINILEKNKVSELKYVSIEEFKKLIKQEKLVNYDYLPELINRIEEEEYEGLFN